jgi:hypothetical protein
MTTTEAIEATFTTPLFKVLKTRLSKPELLRDAAVHCFLFPLSEGSLSVREKKIKNSLLHLKETGEYIE